MKFAMTIRSSDPDAVSKISQIEIDGVAIKEQPAVGEIQTPIMDWLVYIGEHVGFPLTVGLFARMLHDILKDGKDNELWINGQRVEIDAQEIEQIIINASKEAEMNKPLTLTRDAKQCPKCKYSMERGWKLYALSKVTLVKDESLTGDSIDVYVCPNCGHIELYKETVAH
ncbi:MAG TPA: hypothetical protein VMT06_00440 [Candidatus Eisenbacteria bacterium]|jgi:hypothetical protein|nr:hypothetical protein [Candidatus Eisenbacteria bacterium]